MNHALDALVSTAKIELCTLGLSEKTLKTYDSRAFKPIQNLHKEKYGSHFKRTNLSDLKNAFREQYTAGVISRKTLNWRIRGVEILLEIHTTGTYHWKKQNQPNCLRLCPNYERILLEFTDSLLCSDKRKKNYESIVLRFLKFIEESLTTDISFITQEHLQKFIINISTTRPSSMDDVITGLRKFFRFLNGNQYFDETFWMLMAVPKARNHKVYPCMEQKEIIRLVNSIDSRTNIGKRDFAILVLAIATGLRAGDLASLQLTDIDWKNHELHFCQGKTNTLLVLPLSKDVLNAIADYILHARPKTNDPHLFIRSLAPYIGMNDGVSIARIFRKYLKLSNIAHVIGDGKTMHGIRRSMGTVMVSENIPVTTVAQVLGHKGMKATKQYIALDLNGLKKCALPLHSLGGAGNE